MISLALLLAAAPAPAPKPVPPRSFIPPVSLRAVVTTPSGLRFETLRPGTGAKPMTGDLVLVTYEGHLADGTLFDASPQPTAFPVTGVVPGFAEALQGRFKGVLRVRCTAFGRLPSGKTAKSHLDYGGDPKAHGEVVKRVLEMVARGVITRLAELERVRRGELERARVRLPPSGELD